MDEPVDELGALPGDCEACLQTLAAQPLLQALSERDALFEASARAAQSTRRPPTAVTDAVCGERIDVVRERLGAPGAVHGECQASWDGRFAEHCHDPTQFVADNLRLHAVAWQQWVPQNTRDGKLVVEWISRGYRFQLVAPAAAPDDRRGKTAARLEALRKLMRGFLSSAEVDAAIHSPVPPRFRMPNHTSVLEHADFVEAELLGYLGTGAISIAREEDVHCVLALGVVDHRSGKRRLIVDGRPINFWQAYLPFSFERLSDLPQYLELGDLLVVLDAKSGYHHIGVAVEHRRYLCVQFKGVLFQFNVLPFGVAQACYAYTKVMRQVYAPLRARGWKLTHYIDDLLMAQQPRERACFDVVTLTLLFVALGWFLSVSKCQAWPQARACFLGLRVDTHALQFSIPEDKLEYILGVLGELLAAAGASRRQYAQVAGLLASVAMAVPMSRLYLRGLNEILRGGRSWDTVFPFSTSERQELRWWFEHLPRLHGRKWRLSTRVLVVVGDVSESGFAGYTPGGEVEGRIGGGFSQEDMALLALGQWSSTVRETRNAEFCIIAVCETLGAAAAGSCIRYVGDNEGSIAALERQTGSADVFAIVKRVHLYCYERGVDLALEWRPRTDPQVAYADHLSRYVDYSAIFITRPTYRRVCEQMGCHPNLDVFAGGGKDEHRTAQYFTVCACPGSSGVDAFAQDWLVTPKGQRALVWVFPPHSQVAACLRRIERERVECLLVLPTGSYFWESVLHRLEWAVRQTVPLPFRPNVYWLGSQAPRAWRDQKRKFSFVVYRVSFLY